MKQMFYKILKNVYLSLITYVMFSSARNSCSRNHWRYTLCGYHHGERHQGQWLECKKCKESFDTEDYVFYGTNEYNFVKLKNTK
jgi:hypothetical protein